MEHGLNQAISIGEHQAAGAGHGRLGRSGFRLHPQVHLAGHGGLEVVGAAAAGAQGPQRIGAGGHGLGPQGLQGPAGGHLAAHHAGQVGLQSHQVHRLQGLALGPDPQAAPVAALLQPNAAPGAGSRQGLHHQLTHPQALGDGWGRAGDGTLGSRSKIRAGIGRRARRKGWRARAGSQGSARGRVEGGRWGGRRGPIRGGPCCPVGAGGAGAWPRVSHQPGSNGE